MNAFRTAQRGYDQFMLRLLPGMREALKAQAKAHGRSANSEVLFLIDQGMKMKGPATAPTVPDHGPNHPEKDKVMNDGTNITGPAKAPAPKPTDEQVADAMRSLENDIRELMLMADIATAAWDGIGPPKAINDNCFQYQCTRLERDSFDFLINNVAERASLLRKRFDAAWCGETV